MMSMVASEGVFDNILRKRRIMIRNLIDSFFELSFLGKVRVCMLGFWSLILLRELFYCIIDGMIHTVFVVGVLMTATYLVIHLHKETGDSKYKSMSIITTMGFIIFIIFMGWSSIKCDTIEVINVGLGRMYVNVMGNDMFLVSNGREVIVSSVGGQSDLYLVNSENDDDEIVINHYTSRYPELEAKYYDGKLVFTAYGGDVPVISAIPLKEQHFYYTELNLWRIYCYDIRYKSKNIFGGNGFYLQNEEEYIYGN